MLTVLNTSAIHYCGIIISEDLNSLVRRMRTGDTTMPKVGQKHYPYTKKGREQAKAAAKRKGATVKYGKKKY